LPAIQPLARRIDLLAGRSTCSPTNLASRPIASRLADDLASAVFDHPSLAGRSTAT